MNTSTRFHHDPHASMQDCCDAVSHVHDGLNALFNGLFNNGIVPGFPVPWSMRDETARPRTSLIPGFDAWSDASAWHIDMELPGVAPEEVDIVVRDGLLRISGEKKAAERSEGAASHVMGRTYGSFLKTFPMPDDADADAVTARFRNGVLTVDIPRKAPAPEQERRVAIVQE